MMEPNHLKVHDIIEPKNPIGMHGKPHECLETETSIVHEPGDIYIVTYPKTGTTLLQYMCHLLRTNGEGKFPSCFLFELSVIT